MLKKIGLKNIRSFKNLKDFEFKPITVLCGTNSSGKSSIIKTLLLWKQSLENLSWTRPGFVMNGRYTKLGSHDNFLYNKAKNKFIETNLQFKLEEDKDTFTSRDKELLKLTLSENDVNSADLIELDFTLRYKANNDNNLGVDIKQYVLKITPVENKSKKKPLKKRGDAQNNFSPMELKITLIESGRYKIEWENIAYRGVRQNTLGAATLFERLDKLKKGEVTLKHELGWDLFFHTIISIDPDLVHMEEIGNEEDRFAISRIAQILDRMSSFLEYHFKNISYIGPLREEPSRRYIFEDTVDDIGVKGENSAFLYNKENIVPIDYVAFDPIKEVFEPKSELPRTAINNWLSEIGILGFESEKNEELYRLSLSANEFSDKKVNIADVGFGVSQVIPIVIQGLLMGTWESALILEQPEIHLHPKMQMKLADFILSLALSGKKVIIETHSEHMINRFVRRIVEDTTGELNSLIGINFIKNSADGSICEAVNLSETKGIVNWPEEFFDQAAEEHQKIMNAIINKKIEKKK